MNLLLRLAPVLLLAACARHGAYSYSDDGTVPYDGTDPAALEAGRSFAPSRYYQPPGPPQDPWGPYITEAAGRFHVPEQWVRAVMHQESGGQEQAVSPVGAMGLMQVMPATYQGLQARHALGHDPFDPHNNILAGTAYIREMYDRYGAPGFLAAYNAGPDRVDLYLSGATSLPDETVNYLAAITPHLGNDVPLSGPLAMYASATQGGAAAAPSVTSLAAGCDVNAAYDPDHPCAPLEQAAVAPVRLAAAEGCDPDAAYDPSRPCQPAKPVQPRPLPAPGGAWSIQVGAFANPSLARAVAEGARAEAPAELRAAGIALPVTTPFGGSVLYRARLVHLTANAASEACDHLNRRQLPCVVVQPSGS